MADPNPYIIQAKQNIISLISENKLEKAYKLCEEFLNRFPEESVFSDLKDDIAERAEEENERAVKEKIESIEELWDQKKYVEILKELKPLFVIAPNNKKLTDLYQKAQKEYKKQIEKQEEIFEKEQREKFDELLKSNPNQLLFEISELERGNSQNANMKAFLKEYKSKIIASKIKDKRELLESNDYTSIRSFIKEISSIDPGAKELIEVQKKLMQKVNEEQVDQKKEYIYKNSQHLNELFKLGKYDKAIQVAKEILRLDSDNKRVKNILEKAKHRLFGQTRDEAIDKIEEDFSQLKAEYKNNKEEFVRL